MARVIAIDGPSGAGKGTVSRLLAERIGFQYLDTGALYRAVALYLLRKGIKSDCSVEEIAIALTDLKVLYINGRVYISQPSGDNMDSVEDVSDVIRTTEIGHYASVFSAKKSVRDFLLQIQRDAAIKNDIVAEGRDMTTIVFPDAWKKFYLDATTEERARRRFIQLKEKGIDITMEDALRDVIDRDIRDSSRDIAPLKRVDEAIYIDTTNLNINEVVEEILKEINK